MRKIFTLLILLLLLPVTALAAGDAPAVLYVGNYQITNTSGTTYLKAGSTRGSLEEGSETDWTVKYAPTTATLTLKGANITGNYHQYYNPHTAGIYALCSQDQPVALTIELIGTNTITGTYGIFLNAEINASSYGTNATLTITGENNGSLGVSGSDHGIYVKSGTGNASLNIKNVAVTSSTNGNYAAGVYVMSSMYATNSPNLSLSVDGGSLTTSGTGNSDGILFHVGQSQATGATTSLTVSENAIVDARNGGIEASDSSMSDLSDQIKVSSGDGTNGGIVFDGTEGTVYGKVELQKDLEIKSGETLTIPQGASLNANGKLTNDGTINVESGGSVSGSLSGGSTEITTPTITTHPTSQTVTEGDPATFAVTASDVQSYQWQQRTNSGSDWTNISENATSSTYTISNTTTDMSGYQYRCVVTSASGVSVISSAATLTVNQSVSPTSYSISANVAPAGAGTVTVNGSGTSATVTANSDVTLTATANDGYRFTGWMENDRQVSTDATYTFKATGDRTLTAKFEKKVTGVTLNTETLELFTGGSATLTATVEPSDAANQNVTWQSDNANVATVQNGTVNAVGAGEATITVTTEDGSKTATCIVTVTVPVTGVTLEPTSLSLFTGDTAPLTATVQPSDATNQNVTWSSDKPEVAIVNNGTVKAMGAGDATITVTTEDVGKTATCVVQVRKPATVAASGSTNISFTTDRNEFTLTATVHAQGNDLNPKDGSWTWTVADADVVALSGSPTWRSQSYSISRQAFTIEGTGTTTITAIYDDGTYRGSVDFTVQISKPSPPDPISYYNIYVEDVCDGVEVSTSKQVVREGGSITVYVEKDTANYTFDNFHVYYKEGYYDSWDELKEGTQPGEYPIKNIWTHIYIKAEGAEEKEDPTGIESIEGVKVYTKDGSLYVQTPQREQIIIVSMSGAVVKNEEQIGLKQYHGLQPGIYIVRVGDKAYKLRLN